jgi:hypothetical protein
MPQRDTIHDIVRQALVKQDWEITNDPYVISFGERFLFIDLAANRKTMDKSAVRLIGAKRGQQQIAIEIKEFRGQSAIADLEQAIGQYVLYRLLLQQVDPARDLYLAVAKITFEAIFSEPIGELVLDALPLKLLVIDIETVEVEQWIPFPETERLSSK